MKWISLILLILLLPGAANAACTVSSTGVAFGTYDTISGLVVDSSGTITITCNTNEKVDTQIGPSANSGGFNPRQMLRVSGTDRLSYNLYTTALRTTIWGDGTGGTAAILSTRVNRTTVNLTVFGRIPASQDVSAGLYQETLVVTIIF